jgi:hypothetical protein
MSRGPWKPNPTKEAHRLIEVAKAQGLAVTSIEASPDGRVRIGTQSKEPVPAPPSASKVVAKR